MRKFGQLVEQTGAARTELPASRKMAIHQCYPGLINPSPAYAPGEKLQSEMAPIVRPHDAQKLVTVSRSDDTEGAIA